MTRTQGTRGWSRLGVAIAAIGVGILTNALASAQPCDAGTVNAGAGPIVPVLSVNGRTGSATVVAGTPIHIAMDAAPMGPPSARYVLWAWLGPPTGRFDLTFRGSFLGCAVSPTPFHRPARPQPFRCVRGAAVPPIVCAGVPELPGPPSAPWMLTHRGLGRPIVLTLQGVVADAGAANPARFSTTNAVTIHVVRPDLFAKPLLGLPASIQTDAGAQSAIVEGQLMFRLSPPDSMGIREIFLDELSLGTSSAPTAFSETGGMSFLARTDTASGSWDTTSGQLFLGLQFDVGYWLLHEVAPFLPQTGDLDDLWISPLEQWSGALTGHAALSPDGRFLTILGDFSATVDQPITGSVFQLSCTFQQQVPKKEFNDPNCPEEKRCNKKKLCIQPVIFKANATDASPTGSSLEAMRTKAINTWAKCCVELCFRDPITIIDASHKVVDGPFSRGEIGAEAAEIFRSVDGKGEDDCIEVFFVSSFADPRHHAGDGMTVYPGEKLARSIVADDAVSGCDPPADKTLAHELGHAMGLKPHDNAARPGVMKAGGNPPNCPANPPCTVKKAHCEGLNNPLLKEKNPKENCCKSWDNTDAFP